VDMRERQSLLPDLLEAAGLKLKYELLEIGDYILSPETAIERKTIRDFVTSIYDGRIFEQSSELSKAFRHPIILLEGEFSLLKGLVDNVKVVYGAILSLTLNYNSRLIYSPSVEDSALIIETLYRQIFEKRPRVRPPKVRKERNIGVQQILFIASIPGIGTTLAERLLEAFGTPMNVVNAPVAELSKVEGVGTAKAKKLREFLGRKYAKRYPLDVLYGERT